ncbi:MAG: hypothetical protein WCC22_08680 [Terriglobales bacterium]
MSEAALEATVQAPVENVEPQPAETPTFEKFSEDLKAGKINATSDGEKINPAGNRWSADRNQFVNAARDEQGRFTAVRERLAQSQKKSEYVKAVLSGTIEPTEQMDADTWGAARNASIAMGASKITAPNFDTEKPADGGETAAETPVAEPLSPEQVAHNAAHQEMLTKIWVRLDEPEVSGLKNAMTQAFEMGATPLFFNDVGHFAADHPNGEDVLFHLGAHPEKLAAYSLLTKDQLANTIGALSHELSARGKRSQTNQTRAPAPPEPVGARATATAFDVSDEKISADEWARQRNEQLAKRRR